MLVVLVLDLVIGDEVHPVGTVHGELAIAEDGGMVLDYMQFTTAPPVSIRIPYTHAPPRRVCSLTHTIRFVRNNGASSSPSLDGRRAARWHRPRCHPVPRATAHLTRRYRRLLGRTFSSFFSRPMPHASSRPLGLSPFSPGASTAPPPRPPLSSHSPFTLVSRHRASWHADEKAPTHK